MTDNVSLSAVIVRLTALQHRTLAIVAAGNVSERNTGYGSWRIFGASPNAVGALRKLGLIERTKIDDREYCFVLTAKGKEAQS